MVVDVNVVVVPVVAPIIVVPVVTPIAIPATRSIEVVVPVIVPVVVVPVIIIPVIVDIDVVADIVVIAATNDGSIGAAAAAKSRAIATAETWPFARSIGNSWRPVTRQGLNARSI